MRPLFGKILLAAALFLLCYFFFTWAILSLSFALRLLEPVVIIITVLVIVVCGLQMLWGKK